MQLRRPAALGAALALAASALAILPVARAAAPAGCAAGSAPEAVRTLLGPSATVEAVDSVEGLPSVLATTPEVLPGIRHRLVQARGVWCDPAGGLAAIATAHDLDAVAAARLVASTVGATFFDGVTIERASRRGDVVHLSTHALTNGVEADWTVDLDGEAVIGARFTARRLGVEPLVAELEGPTALPGLSVGWQATPAGGLVAVDDPFVEVLAGDHHDEPVQSSVIQLPDGFTIVVSRGAPYVAPTMRTSVRPVDVMAVTVETTRANYEEFLAWGLEPPWSIPVGQVFLDGPLGLACVGCVLPTEVFNIHISSLAVETLEAVGYRYDSWEQGFSNVIGHELFHNVQVAYANVEQTLTLRTDFSYVEGFARFQESLHSYSEVSHQPQSLLYLGGGSNSCNGYLGAPTRTDRMERGIVGRTYSACYFWASLYADHGPPLVEGLLEALPDSARFRGSQSGGDLVVLVEEATGAPFLDAVEDFAVRALSWDDAVWGPIAGDGPILDWGQHLHRWTPAPLSTGPSRTLGTGGVTGGQVTAPIEVVPVVEGGDARFLVVTDSGGTVTTEVVSGPQQLAPPADGSRWLMAIGGLGGAQVRFADVADPPPDLDFEPVAATWTTEASRSVRSDLQTAETSGTAADGLFSLAAHTTDSLPGASVVVTADATVAAVASASHPVEPGTYEVVARLALDDAQASIVRRGPFDNPQVDLHALMEVQCPDVAACTWGFAEAPLRAEPGTVELVATITIHQATTAEVSLVTSVRARSVGGDADGVLNGRLTELAIGRRP